MQNELRASPRGRPSDASSRNPAADRRRSPRRPHSRAARRPPRRTPPFRNTGSASSARTDDRGTARTPCGRRGRPASSSPWSAWRRGSRGRNSRPDSRRSCRGWSAARAPACRTACSRAIDSRIHSRNPYAPFSPRYLRLFCSRSAHLSVQWSTNAGLAISLSISLLRFSRVGVVSAANARTSSGVGSWPVRSSETRRRNAASSIAGDGWIFSRCSLASIS